jgi:hypothetical protein
MAWKPKKPKIVEDIQKGAQKVADALNPQQIAEAAQNEANALAEQYKAARGGGGDFDDCVAVVAAGCAAAGAAKGGPVGAAIGAGGGVPLARIACRRVFP